MTPCSVCCAWRNSFERSDTTEIVAERRQGRRTKQHRLELKALGYWPGAASAVHQYQPAAAPA